ncbi:hypothetical protein PMIN06_004513 [Paraphaeosphaeria minitans]
MKRDGARVSQEVALQGVPPPTSPAQATQASLHLAGALDWDTETPKAVTLGNFTLRGEMVENGVASQTPAISHSLVLSTRQASPEVLFLILITNLRGQTK